MRTSVRVAKNTSYLYIKMVMSMLTSLYTARVFLNVLGASDYGLYTLIAGVIAMFGFFQDTLTRASLRYLCFYKEKDDLFNQRRVYSISIILHLGIAAIIALNLLFLSPFLFNGFLNIEEERIYAAQVIYYFMIASFVFAVMTVPYDSILNANEDMLFFSIIGIIENILRLALALYLPYVNSDKLIFFSLIITLISILSLSAKRIYSHLKYEECRIKWIYYDREIARKMISYASWNFLTSISSLIAYNSMPVLLNMFFGTIVNAAQGVAAQVNGVLLGFSNNIINALRPVITKSGSGGADIGKMKSFSLIGSKFSFLVLCIISVPLIVECPYVLKLWLVNVPQWASIFCVLLLLRSVINQLETVYADCVYANENIKNYCIIKGILNLLPIPLVYVWYKDGYPPYMLYVALFICWELLGGLVILYYNKKMYDLDFSEYVKRLLLPCIGIMIISIGIGFVINLIIDESLIRLFLNIIFSVMIISSLSWVVALNREEKLLLINIFSKVRYYLKKR